MWGAASKTRWRVPFQVCFFKLTGEEIKEIMWAGSEVGAGGHRTSISR